MPDNPDIKIDIEALQWLGALLGTAYAAMRNGFLAGYAEEARRQEEAAARERAESGAAGVSGEDETLPRCKTCWCKECGNFEDCIVPIEGYDIESKPCPCDECYNSGKPYMPKEKRSCANYRPE